MLKHSAMSLSTLHGRVTDLKSNLILKEQLTDELSSDLTAPIGFNKFYQGSLNHVFKSNNEYQLK